MAGGARLKRSVGVRAWGWVLPVIALAPGCTCGARSGSAASEGGPSVRLCVTASAAPASSAGDTNASLFSAPIAGARSAGSDVLAGLLAKAGVVRVMGMTDGRVAWTADALKDVAWTPDAELVLQPAHGGLALVWRGMHAGKSGRTLVLLGPAGKCATPRSTSVPASA